MGHRKRVPVLVQCYDMRGFGRLLRLCHPVQRCFLAVTYLSGQPGRIIFVQQLIQGNVDEFRITHVCALVVVGIGQRLGDQRDVFRRPQRVIAAYVELFEDVQRFQNLNARAARSVGSNVEPPVGTPENGISSDLVGLEISHRDQTTVDLHVVNKLATYLPTVQSACPFPCNQTQAVCEAGVLYDPSWPMHVTGIREIQVSPFSRETQNV